MSYGLNLYNNQDKLVIDSFAPRVPQVKLSAIVANGGHTMQAISEGIGSSTGIHRPCNSVGAFVAGATQANDYTDYWSSGYSEWIAFDGEPFSSPAGSYGVCIYDTIGRVSFDSNRKIVKLIGRYNVSAAGSPSGSIVTINHPAASPGTSIFFKMEPYEASLFSIWISKVTFVSLTQIQVWGRWTDGSGGTVYANPNWVLSVFEV